MGIYGIKPRFQQALTGVQDRLVAWGVHPDVLTYAGLAISVAGGGALACSEHAPWLLWLVPPAAFLRTALNALDGMVAKAAGVARPWGEVLNEFCDRLADIALFGGLAVSAPERALPGLAVLLGVLLSSYLGVLSKAAGGPRQYGGIMGKADRMIWLSVASVAAVTLGPAVWPVFLLAVAAGVLVTIVQRAVATHAALQSH
ncbi:MAG: CDP-alcohol phosphatidyltransferase family protein [Chloroflexota bacterium]